MTIQTGDLFPALRSRTQGSIDAHTEHVRRELWEAFFQGRLTDEELASTLDRLEPPRASPEGPLTGPHVSHLRAG